MVNGIFMEFPSGKHGRNLRLRGFLCDTGGLAVSGMSDTASRSFLFRNQIFFWYSWKALCQVLLVIRMFVEVQADEEEVI
jgi:hypothetical protein